MRSWSLGFGLDRKPRRGHGSARSAGEGASGSAVVGMEAPDGCAELVAQCSGAGHDHEVEGRGCVRCEAGCDPGISVCCLRRHYGILHGLAGDG